MDAGTLGAPQGRELTAAKQDVAIPGKEDPTSPKRQRGEGSSTGGQGLTSPRSRWGW